MKGPSMMGKIQYGQSSKPVYGKGNGKPANKGLSMMGHPSFIKGGKKKK